LAGFVPALIGLLFFGALLWARECDPFHRIWFKVGTRGHSKTECITVLPKTAQEPLPVAIYLQDSGGSLLESGNELRQMAEIGLAVVGMDYDQTNQMVFDEQFTALLEHVRRQKWADTNQIACVGFSRGAQRELAFVLNHVGLQPGLLIQLAGGWVPELEENKTKSFRAKVLLIHGERDEVFPLAEAQRVASCLQSNGVPVELKILAAQSHSLGPNRLQVFRAIGEYCLTQFRGSTALSEYRSILSWQKLARPLWLYWIPAGIWVGIWLFLRRREGRGVDGEISGGSTPMAPLKKWEVGLRWLAAALAVLASVQTALHLIVPQMDVDPRTLAIARKYLVQSKELNDFDCLVSSPVWQRTHLKVLLEHVQLASYNRELINWKLDDQTYREYVLSPQIDLALDGGLQWRRPLWENFYPRIRKEQTPEAAAEIVGRFLRERVTVRRGMNRESEAGKNDQRLQKSSPTILGIWEGQIADEKGYEAVYVAAMRSVGIPSRLNSDGQAELFTGKVWQLAPRPLVGVF
jgi:predicted esterase